MCFKKNNSKTQPAEETNEMNTVADDKLGDISGAGNPWQGIKGVPPQPIDEDTRKKV